MDFLRGATLATAQTLGLADTSNLGPTAGNGFFRRWPDDLATLQAHGITDVRLTLDWSRLQPKPGVVDGDWAEQYEQIIRAGHAIGLRIWATMYDGDVPRWFDNEGGIDSDEALSTWWPRYVERVADRFGDLVGGWVPFATIPPGAPEQPWRDTWGLLGDGTPPVIASVAGSDAGRAARLSGMTDLIGIDLDLGGEAIGPDPADRRLVELADRWGESISAVGTAADVPAAVGLTLRHDDPDVGARLVAAMVDAIGWAVADGTGVSVCFVDPAIAGPGDTAGLFDADRAPLPALAAFVSDS